MKNRNSTLRLELDGGVFSPMSIGNVSINCRKTSYLKLTFILLFMLPYIYLFNIFAILNIVLITILFILFLADNKNSPINKTNKENPYNKLN